MKQNVLENIHRKTINLLMEANEQMDSKDNKFWYNNQFYSGSLTPEILFVGYNPGYDINNWSNRTLSNDDLKKPFELKQVKYIDEKNERLGSQIYFLLETIFDNSEEFLRTKVAETNFIHFNTPNISIYNESIRKLNQETKKKLENHFIESFKTIIDTTQPKVIYIIGISTFKQLSKKIEFNNLEILETNKKGHLICAKTTLKKYPNINVIVSKHLSAPISDSSIGSIGVCLKSMLKGG